MKQKFVNYFMKIAEATAELSTAVRLKVGAVIVKDQQIIATGYNGTPSGWDNTCETTELLDIYTSSTLKPDEILAQYPYEGTFWVGANELKTRYRLKTKPEVLHAEMNCLMKIAQSTESSKNTTLFTTTAPCLDCAKAIFQSGVQEVFYKDLYRSEEGLYFLEKCGIKLTKFVREDK